MKHSNNRPFRKLYVNALSTLALSTGLISSVSAKEEITTELLQSIVPFKDNGISPYATLIGEMYHNHRGGIEQGSAFANLVDIGIELDFEKISGWEGASIFANLFYFTGDDISGRRVGDFNAVSNLYTDTSFNIYNIFFQQSFDSGNSFFKLGQIALDDDFMVSESALLFLNASFGPMPILSGNTGAPIYALAAPGGVVNFELKDSHFLQLGAYVGNSGSAESRNQGFGWKTGNSAGWMLMAEAGLNYGEDDASVFKIGGYFHSGDYERFTTGSQDSGIYSFYTVIDHQVMSAGESSHSVNVFLRGGISPQDDIAAVTAYADTGIVARNVFQENDALGFGISWTNFSDDSRQTEGGSSSETILEMTYQFSINDTFTIQPDIQYIINPQGGGNHGFLTGLRAEIKF